MKKEESIRDYNFSDATLKQKTDDVMNSATRDIAELSTRGVPQTRLDDLKQANEDFADLPTDEELQGEVTSATELKDEAGEKVKTHSRNIRTMAQNKLGEKSGKYKAFAFQGMDELEDDKLYRLGKRVARKAQTNLVALGSEGLTQAKIDALKADNLDLDNKIDDKNEADETRDIATQTRIDAGNAIFSEITKICNTGKDYWFDKDEAKYNDYVINNTPGGDTDPVPPPA